MNPEKIKEDLKFHTELLKLFVVVLIALGGGLASILLSSIAETEKANLMLVVGGVLFVTFLTFAIFTIVNIYFLLAQIR
jgi:hypothetical protein